jgi:hypothetical protein
MKKIYTTLAILVLSISVFAQDKNDSLFTNTIDLASRYVWRGTDFGASPSIQPGVKFNKNNLTIGAWGSFALIYAGLQETDLYVTYTIKEKFAITLTDYFFPTDTTTYNYFEYDSKETGHILETTLSWLGTEKHPITFLVAANVWGNDAKRLKADSVTQDGIQYSAYAELGYTYRNVNAFVGFNLTNPDEKLGEVGFYGKNYGFVNVGVKVTREIKINDNYSVPVAVSLITNPQAKKIYLTGVISF